MKRKRERSRRLGKGARKIIVIMKQSGYLFPETDEQMAAYEAGVKIRELPEKFRTPDFVFEEASKVETVDKNV